MAPHIMLVEDSVGLRQSLTAFLESMDYFVTATGTIAEAKELSRKASFDLILCDFRLPDATGIDLLNDLREQNRSTLFVMMTAYGSIEIAIEAMKAGANDFVCKPFEPEHLEHLIRELLAHGRVLARHSEHLASFASPPDSSSTEVLEVYSQAQRAAASDCPILILGESGTGKELLARHIHDSSDRAQHPFVAINCGALPEFLLESELFGHAAGAFTGATQERIGLLEHASNGTLFLDEVGEIPLSLQVKLLRALQEGEIRPLGSNEYRTVSPKIVAATHQSPETLLEKGLLREDFYYRINVISLELPPLRERKEDIESLALYFLQNAKQQLSDSSLYLTPEAITTLKHYHWPGNIRELENAILRAVVMADNAISPRHLGVLPDLDYFTKPDYDGMSLSEVSKRAACEAEKELLIQALHHTHGNKRATAELLQVSYKTVINKTKEYGISVEKQE